MSSFLRKLQKRNSFDLSESNALSLRMGDLVPIYVNHLVPGDTFDIESFLAARFAPMQSPISSDIEIKTWGFATPYRLLWDDSDDFFKGKNKRGDDVDPVFPRVDYSRITSEMSGINEIARHKVIGSLSDYLDLSHKDFDPTSLPADLADIFRSFPVESVLELRNYQMIYNEWFRDQNVDEPVEFLTDSHVYSPSADGDVRDLNELKELLTLRKKRWAKDYFTSALPTPSLAPDVEIPIHGEIGLADVDKQAKLVHSQTNSGISGTLQATSSNGLTSVGNYRAKIDPNGTLEYDNNSTIRELTLARATYQYLLDVARGGAVRMKDWVRTMFNVDLPDYRAMIPEYIGGGTQNVIVNEVLQTSETSETPQGNMSGRATSIGKGHKFHYKAKEHTIIMIIACVMPRPLYGSGLPKRHFKFDRFDYYLPQFDHIGDQEIKRKELFYNEDKEKSEETFGYSPRFSEYKSSCNRIHGQFRTTLHFWTMARLFNNYPSLSSAFLEPDDRLLDRPFYVQSGDTNPELEHVYLEVGSRVTAWRPMSKNSTPIV